MLPEERMSRRRFLQTSASGMPIIGNVIRAGSQAGDPASPLGHIPSAGQKIVVLTFDDASKSHRTFVAPFLRDMGFGATFFVSHRWMNDRENFMTWEEIADVHQMGFEIGNHTWTHDDFSSPKNVARLAGELNLVEKELNKVGVPRPISFAYPGDTFSPGTVKVLKSRGYRFARRGMQPEIPYGEMRPGPAYDPERHHPLLVPTTGDAYPDWTLQYFEEVVSPARNGKIVVVQFHGVPDQAHPWVYTPPENFRKYMTFLRENQFRAIALRDLQAYVNLDNPPDDPMLKVTYPQPNLECPAFPAEVLATRADLKFWLENMLRYHRYSLGEAAEVCGMSEDELRRRATEWGLYPPLAVQSNGERVRVLPYPGGRPPRIGFQEGEINPLRGTKASVFLPWDPASYVVVDLPEAVFCNLGLIFLAHTDIPTLWNEQNLVVENTDWAREPNGVLSNRWYLDNGIVLGTSLRPVQKHVEMQLWLRNFCGKDLSGFERESGLRGQVCVMLKGAPEFNGQTNTNKVFDHPAVAVQSVRGDRWVLTAWERFGRSWGNALCPCMHSDPELPNCPFGETVRVRGRIWFYEGKDIRQELERARSFFEREP